MCLSETGSEISNDVVLSQNPRGDIELPKAIYLSIASELPLCLQRGDDDRCSIEHFPSLPLKTETEASVVLHTRNVGLIAHLLEEKGFRVGIRRSFSFEVCNTLNHSPSPEALNLLAKIKCANTNVHKSAETIYEAVTHSLAGLLVSHDCQSKFDYAAILCGLFPDAPIVFVVPSADEVNNVASELDKRLPEKVHQACGIHSAPECRITVATFTALSSEDLRDAPFVIVPVWKPGFPKWMRRLTWNPYRDRIYFLLTTSDRISHQDADNLAGRLGPILMQPECPSTGSTTFSTFRFGGDNCRDRGPSPNSRTFDASDRRKLYWRHRHRNKAIAAIARCLGNVEGTIAILVENRDHAEQLSRLLPDWTVVQKDAIPTSEAARTIITLTAADTWPKFQPETVVNSMGGSPSRWLIDFVEGLSRDGKMIRIVDLTDGFDVTAGRLAATRENAYRASGWHFRPLNRSVVQAVGRAIRSKRLQKASEKGHCDPT